MPPGIAIFDLDGTITRRGTFTPFLFHCMGALGRSRVGMIAACLPALAAHGLGLTSRGALKARMLALSIAGSSSAEVAGWAPGFDDTIATASVWENDVLAPALGGVKLAAVRAPRSIRRAACGRWRQRPASGSRTGIDQFSPTLLPKFLRPSSKVP